MNILITGGAGFIGSNLIKYLLKKYDYFIINLDALTYAGNLDNLNEIHVHPRYHFVQGDICNRELLDGLFIKYEINAVINVAAESHVDRSINDPEIFLKTNVLGTQSLLDASKKHWNTDSSNKRSRKYQEGVKFIQISTDEVYGTLGDRGYFTETTNLAPNSPYSASKAASDMIVRAYYETYGLPINITRCSNNYGPYQNAEKLIPSMITRALDNKPLPLYGDGKHVRDWLHVEDHCAAIDLVLHKGKVGEVYNIGGNYEMENLDLVKLILSYLGKDESLIQFVSDRLGHDRRYAIDYSKISSQLGWYPSYTLKDGLKSTINWYLANKHWIINAKKRNVIS